MTIKELINQYVTAHADNRWMDASELEALLTEFAEKLQEPASPCENCEGNELPGTCASISSPGRCPLEYNQEPASEDLEQAARDYRDKTEFQYPNQLQPAYEGFKVGAQWQKEQMMKDAVEGEVTGIGPLINGQVLDTQKQIRRLSSTYSFGNSPYCEMGDKVKVIIIKE